MTTNASVEATEAVQPAAEFQDASQARDSASAAPAGEEPPKLSKNALKRKRRQQEWEDNKAERRVRRKEKRHERQSRRREAKASLLAEGKDPDSLDRPAKGPTTRVPIGFILDCDFEQYMSDKERISLSSQVTRCYSENKNARYCGHLFIAGFKGKLRQRYTEVLRDVHKNWRGVNFVEDGFVECAQMAREKMAEKGGVLIEALQRPAQRDHGGAETSSTAIATQKQPGTTLSADLDLSPEPEPPEHLRNVVYLTSDSPYTLERLEPNTSYVVGGLVDKNREKGLCYRRARAVGMRTAKLPIGQFMQMQVRHVLATNHVVDIMLKWLEYQDWGKAFMAVIPARKRGVLLAGDGAAVEGKDGHDDDGDEGDESEASAGDDGRDGVPDQAVLLAASTRTKDEDAAVVGEPAPDM